MIYPGGRVIPREIASAASCKGIFRCFGIFLQTALMADDCVPKVTPGENEASPSLALPRAFSRNLID